MHVETRGIHIALTLRLDDDVISNGVPPPPFPPPWVALTFELDVVESAAGDKVVVTAVSTDNGIVGLVNIDVSCVMESNVDVGCVVESIVDVDCVVESIVGDIEEISVGSSVGVAVVEMLDEVVEVERGGPCDICVSKVVIAILLGSVPVTEVPKGCPAAVGTGSTTFGHIVLVP